VFGVKREESAGNRYQAGLFFPNKRTTNFIYKTSGGFWSRLYQRYG
jgi:hypothetical protein